MRYGNQSEIIMYQTEDGKTKIDVRLEEETSDFNVPSNYPNGYKEL